MMQNSPENKLTFTTAHQKRLKQQIITRDQPGTLLQDFEMMLDYLLQHEVVLTPTKQLQNKTAEEMNGKLAHPAEMGIQRPSTKSYPHVLGLFLLLRASGLTHIVQNGKKAVLTVKQSVLESWRKLNPTEQYGHLLESWMLRGYEEIIGERSSWFSGPQHLGNIAMYLLRENSFSDTIEITNNADMFKRISYLGWYNIALMVLFGIIEVQVGERKEKIAWNVEQINFTPYGEALTILLFSEMMNIFEWSDEGTVGQMQKKFKRYFPQWKQTLSFPEPAFREGTHVFKVLMRGVDVWRRIAIDASLTFEDFAFAILDSVNFDNDHLFEFSYTDEFGVRRTINYSPSFVEVYADPPYADEVRVGDVPLDIGQQMVFWFDFGDDWKFDVFLEAVEPTREEKTFEIIGSHGTAPKQYPGYDDDEWENYEEDSV